MKLDWLTGILIVIPIFLSVFFVLSAVSNLGTETIIVIGIILCVIDLSVHIIFVRQDKIIEQ